MKTIKVKFCEDPKVTNPHTYAYFLLQILKKYYNVELSEKPDYLFYTDSNYDHRKYDCVKIYCTGENISPNFNICDYAIGFDRMTFEDRYYRLPLYAHTVFYNPDELKMAGKDYLYTSTHFTKEDLAKKKEFCSFVYSNYRSETERKKMFDTLSTYKKVNAGGSYLNNMGGRRVNNKLEFELQHKFSIAFENSSRSGYVTEKIVSSIVANTIPIYWGSPTIGEEFNTKRFINCHDYASFEKVLERVRELDTNDEAFLEMINQPLAAEGYDFKKIMSGFEEFLTHIFDQPLEQAKRATINPVQALQQKKNIALIAHYTFLQSLLLSFAARLYKPLKKIKFLETLKQWYFKV